MGFLKQNRIVLPVSDAKKLHNPEVQFAFMGPVELLHAKESRERQSKNLSHPKGTELNDESKALMKKLRRRK